MDRKNKRWMVIAVLLLLCVAFAAYWLVPISGRQLVPSPEEVVYGRVEYRSSTGTRSYQLGNEDLAELVGLIAGGKYKRVGVIGPKNIERYTLYLQDAAKDYQAVLSIDPSGRIDKMEFNGWDTEFLQYNYCFDDFSSILRLLGKKE